MNQYRFNSHFNNVARSMNNYVIASSYNYHWNRTRDQRNYLLMHQTPSLVTSGLSGVLAYGLHAVGMPANVVKFGYHFGSFLDNNA
jgi:hypothetical protein